MRSGLLVAQMALAVMMLVGAGLVVRSFTNLRTIDLGFNPANVLSLRVEQQVPQPPPNQFMHQLLERVTALPGVESAGAVFLRPLALGPIGQGVRVVLEGQPQTAGSGEQESDAELSDRNARLLRGDAAAASARPLVHAGRTRPNAPRVAIVSETTARQLWPARGPARQTGVLQSRSHRARSRSGARSSAS